MQRQTAASQLRNSTATTASSEGRSKQGLDIDTRVSGGDQTRRHSTPLCGRVCTAAQKLTKAAAGAAQCRDRAQRTAARGGAAIREAAPAFHMVWGDTPRFSARLALRGRCCRVVTWGRARHRTSTPHHVRQHEFTRQSPCCTFSEVWMCCGLDIVLVVAHCRCTVRFHP